MLISLVSRALPPELASGAQALVDHLRRCGLEVREGTAGDAVLVLGTERLPEGDEDALLADPRPVLLVGPHLSTALTDAAGLVPGVVTPVHEVRVRPGPDAVDVMARSAGDVLVRDRWMQQEKFADDVQVLLTANSAFTDHPIATWRPATTTGVLTLGSTPEAYTDPGWQRLVHRLLRRLLGQSDGAPVRIGVLGYGAIGHEHNAAIAVTEGLSLAAVADTNPARLEAARELAPKLRAHATGEELLADDQVDLVVVSTPPNTHADWVLRCLEAGKHVVVEKPFCLTVAEADRQIAAAAERGLSLSVYQNRRWDADYLALKKAVRAGRLGEVFHLETFLGGYGHPCNYWHSDEAVSGGAIYDWGSHFLDWVLDLLPQDIEWVSATTHKRVWHDVTNADHSRVLVHFVDGVEAEFTHSDLAAALKPKFYALGTQGAITSDWRYERVVARSPIGTLQEDRLAHSDSPVDLRLLDVDGSETRLAVLPAPPQPFHRELADHLLSGAPMSVTPEGSRRNIAVMQAATSSALQSGRPVPLPTS